MGPFNNPNGHGSSPILADGMLILICDQDTDSYLLAVDPATVDFVADTGELIFPLNILGLPYNEVDVTYTAGLATLPNAVKCACAQIVKNAQATPGLNVKSSKVDTLQLQYFSGALVDATVAAMLKPWVSVRMG